MKKEIFSLMLIFLISVISVAGAQSPDVEIVDFTIYHSGGVHSNFGHFFISGSSGSYKKGDKAQMLTPTVNFGLLGNVDVDDNIVFTFYNSSNKEIGKYSKSMGEKINNSWSSYHSMTCEPVKLKAGKYTMTMYVINEAKGKKILLRKCFFIVEEILTRDGSYTLVVNNDGLLGQGWIIKHPRGGMTYIVFGVKIYDNDIQPTVRYYFNGKEMGDGKEIIDMVRYEPCAQFVSAPVYNEKNYTIQWEDMMKNDGKWEAKISAGGSLIRVLKWTICEGDVVRHPEQKKNEDKRLVSDGRFVTSEIIKNSVEKSYLTEMLTLRNMFFGRNPISQ